MGRKKNSNNKVMPWIVIVLVFGAGYWLKGALTDNDTSYHDSETSAVPTVSDDSTLDVAEDNISVVDSIQPFVDTSRTEVTEVIKETQPAPKVRAAKNAYVDEYGNVIYTQPEVRYKTYVQSRWGYEFKYPSFLTQITQSQNSDGVTLEDGKGLKLVVFGGWNIFNETISELYQKDVPNTKSVTYKRLFRKQKSYVKSGYTKNGKTFYMKEAIIGKDDQEVVVTMVFVYPKTYNQQVDKIINEIFSSFPILRN